MVASQSEPRWTAWICWGLVLFLGSIIAYQFRPITRETGRPTSRQTLVKNNLKQIGISTHGFHDNEEHLPNEQGMVEQSWTTQLLPYIEYQHLYGKLNLSLPWDDPHHRVVFEEVLSEFVNAPTLVGFSTARFHDPATGYALTGYSANQLLLDRATALRFEDFADGHGQTILYGEIRDRFPAWGKPGNFRDLTIGINTSPTGFGSFDNDGCYFSFVDGRVEFLSEKIDPKVLEALATPDGGETLSGGAF